MPDRIKIEGLREKKGVKNVVFFFFSDESNFEERTKETDCQIGGSKKGEGSGSRYEVVN